MKLDTFTADLEEALYNYENFDYEVKSVSTFEQAGLLTNNKGLVVRLEDGSEYELTIVPRNEKADEDEEDDEELVSPIGHRKGGRQD